MPKITPPLIITRFILLVITLDDLSIKFRLIQNVTISIIALPKKIILSPLKGFTELVYHPVPS
jgi:hypothetical protein